MEKEKQKVKLNSRHSNNFLIPSGKSRYLLECEFDAIRVGYQQDQEAIAFVDPPGGPMLYVGSPVKELRGDIIESIRHTDKGFELKML